MDPVVAELPKRRGRKRKIIDVQNAPVECDGRRMLQTRSLKLVDRYVLKDFQGSGKFLGKIISYDSGLYRINYEDGDCEDLDSGELKALLIEDYGLTGIWLERKRKLDDFLNKDLNAESLKARDIEEPTSVNQVITLPLSELEVGTYEAEDVVADADSSSDSCEDVQYSLDVSMEVPLIPPPELPPSSGHINVQEEYVSHLLSVYSLLRSFSIPLFLCPFGLDEFVGALNCSAANTLLDSIHVALMHVLRRHFERLSSEGSELALKCLRCLDWSLLDMLTWPVYVINYLAVMDYTNGPDWKGFYSHALERDYYTLSAGRKLLVLQILCDAVLDSEELRAEMDGREESEIGIDLDGTMVCASAGGPRRVHPRYSKTYASNDREAMQGITDYHEINPSISYSIVPQGPEPMGDSTAEDGNGDECRLCGMDGLLLCCDGCPSSYHSRCLGLNKTYMPEGSWYCPECKINVMEPKISRGTELKGGDVCGVDPYEQVFIATCDHLVVLKASVNSGNCLRYYNRHDIPRVIHALYFKAEHAIMYSEICRQIMQCWELTGSILPQKEIYETGLQTDNSERSVFTQSASLSDKPVSCMTEVDYSGTCVTGKSAVGSSISYHMDDVQKPELSGNFFYATTELDLLDVTEPALLSESSIHPYDPRELSQQSTSSVTEPVTHATSNDSYQVNGNETLHVPCLELNNTVDGDVYGRSRGGCLYMGASFKTTDYINYYLHGDFAASAAAHLAILSSEENQGFEPRTSYNRRKGLIDSVSLQLKAFSTVAVRFFWPHTEKKLIEVPRERCSWCFSCKAPVSSRRGCLLNAAASNTNRGAVKAFSVVRPIKNGDGRFPGISAYILFMEESLRGLVVGPFLNDTFRRQWRKQVEWASTCTSIKILLLELEENIRSVALSEDWMKLVDDILIRPSSNQAMTNAAGSIQKRKPGRRGRKPSAAVEIVVDELGEESTDFTWWRGSTVSKLLFRRAFLPCSMIRRAARQGGSKKIPGIHYLEGQETPKRSRQLIWRSAIEMSRSIAQIAHQVRCLDFHVRWADLVHPELVAYDGKGPETEASAFRNAFVCDKKTVKNEIRYCIAFGNQKHLPSRVLKNITEVEQILDDGKERYWFSEARIPLYLIKEYEEKAETVKPVDILTKLQKRQLKALHKDIYSYLSLKRDNMEKDYCCSCNQDLLFRNAIQCSACQGFCHEHCASSSIVHVNDEIEFFITCKQCCETRMGSQVESSNASPTSPLLLQGQDFSNGASSNKSGKKVGCKGSPGTVKALEHSADMKMIDQSLGTKRSKIKHWGLIWKKSSCGDTGIDFRLKNILSRGNPDVNLIKPSCRLCNKAYNTDLMYIRCETCQYWFHADALELDESKILCLVGFKCCKCRRIRSPVCPYTNLDKRKVLEDKGELKKASKGISEIEYDFSASYREEGQACFDLLIKAEISHLAAESPRLFTLSEVEQYTGDKSEVGHGRNNSTPSVSGPRKLPVRRHTRQEKDSDYPYLNPSDANIPYSTEKIPIRRLVTQEHRINSDLRTNSCKLEVYNTWEKNDTGHLQESPSTQTEWVVSNDNFDDDITLDYDSLGCDDMEFEPQTYFSFNELLASDDGRVNGNESSGKNRETSSVIPENRPLEISYDQEEPAISVETNVHFFPCKICSHTEPCPDLSCHACGMWIHSHCSPWVEPPAWENDWKCGHCREWR